MLPILRNAVIRYRKFVRTQRERLEHRRAAKHFRRRAADPDDIFSDDDIPEDFKDTAPSDLMYRRHKMPIRVVYAVCLLILWGPPITFLIMQGPNWYQYLHWTLPLFPLTWLMVLLVRHYAKHGNLK